MWVSDMHTCTPYSLHRLQSLGIWQRVSWHRWNLHLEPNYFCCVGKTVIQQDQAATFNVRDGRHRTLTHFTEAYLQELRLHISECQSVGHNSRGRLLPSLLACMGSLEHMVGLLWVTGCWPRLGSDWAMLLAAMTVRDRDGISIYRGSIPCHAICWRHNGRRLLPSHSACGSSQEHLPVIGYCLK